MRLEKIDIVRKPLFNNLYCYKSMEDWYGDMMIRESLLDIFAEKHNVSYYVVHTLAPESNGYEFTTNVIVYNN